MSVAIVIASPLGAKNRRKYEYKSALSHISNFYYGNSCEDLDRHIINKKWRYRIWGIHSITYFLSVDSSHLHME